MREGQSMTHRLEVCLKSDVPDPVGRKIQSRAALHLGIRTDVIRVADAYIIDRDMTKAELQLIADEVFRDPVIQDVAINEAVDIPYDRLIEVGFRPGVTDNVARTAREAIERTLEIRFGPDEGVYSRKLYFIRGNLSLNQVESLAGDMLANDLIQTWRVYDPGQNRLDLSVPRVTQKVEIAIQRIDLEISDDELMRLSRDGVLALNLQEMVTIRDFFRTRDFRHKRILQGLGYEITDCELEVLAQTWSEHCKHKIFNATIDYWDGSNHSRIDGLFSTYIQAATERIRRERGTDDYCLSVFKDNAGVIKFDDDWNIVMKVETHNSPSALDPYGGALTGIVGVNRDPFGTGLGSELIFNTDVFCFAPPDYTATLPPRLLHPRRVLEGVREGVEHGGNKSGIPTVNGAVVFDERYLGKPLVYCGTAGLMPAVINGSPAHIKAARPGDRIVMTGGRIGKDGIHGATFSSEELHEGSPVSAVQIGDPITQKRMTDFLLVARDRGLYSSITDNGAGGLSSSVGEMARESGGARLFIDRAPLKYPGLQPWEVLLSEAQERMTVAVPPENLSRFLDLAKKMDVEATDLGEFTDDGFFSVWWEDQPAVCLPLHFLHGGLPEMTLEARWHAPIHREPEFECPSDLTADLSVLLSRWNVCSKELFIRQYDHEVQGGTVIKPLVGACEDGPGDAAVICPVLGCYRGLAVGCGITPRYSDIDTYWMMAAVIDEALRNIVSVGADPDWTAGLDNFCWCDPVQSDKTPDGHYKLAQLVRANRALYDLTTAYGIPCISGKDSMKNDYHIGGTKISIPPTVLFTAVGVVPDVGLAVTPDFKRPGDAIYVIGITAEETGGSEYFAQKGFVGNKISKVVDPAAAIGVYRRLHRAMRKGLVASCHDLSDGGLGVALAESAFSGALGAKINLSSLRTQDVHRDDVALFSESPCRFLVSVRPNHISDFEYAMREAPLSAVGQVTDAPRLIIVGLNGKNIVVDADIWELKRGWQAPLGV
jgi:phosphoribosylformylglycinamidine synthase